MHLRRAAADERGQLTELWAATFPQPGAPRANVAIFPDGADAFVGVDADEITAGAVVSLLADQPTSRLLQILATTDEHWASMHRLMVERLRTLGVQRWYVTVREDSTAVRRRLDTHGYTRFSASWGAHLTLTDQTLQHLRVLQGDLPAELSVRELVAGEAAAVHDVFGRNRQDFPWTPATEAQDYTAEQMRQLINDRHAFGVWQEDQLVAVTVLTQRSAEEAETDFTVTDRTMRHRGIATALKAHAVCALAAQGVRRFGTGGAHVNEASRKANQRLGYQLEPLWLTYTRT